MIRVLLRIPLFLTPDRLNLVVLSDPAQQFVTLVERHRVINHPANAKYLVNAGICWRAINTEKDFFEAKVLRRLRHLDPLQKVVKNRRLLVLVDCFTKLFAHRV